MKWLVSGVSFVLTIILECVAHEMVGHHNVWPGPDDGRRGEGVHVTPEDKKRQT